MKVYKLFGGESMPRQARLDAPGILQYVIIRGIEKVGLSMMIKIAMISSHR
jgi:hypothetical protein